MTNLKSISERFGTKVLDTSSMKNLKGGSLLGGTLSKLIGNNGGGGLPPATGED